MIIRYLDPWGSSQVGDRRLLPGHMGVSENRGS